MLSIAIAVVTSVAAAAPAPAAAGALAAVADLPTLSVAELVEAGASGLTPSGAARDHAGKRLRLVGFMARTEEPEAGAFWLSPRPVVCDEGGAGTGDLPAESVRVILRFPSREPLAHLEGLIAVTGTLEVGRLPDARGHVSWLRLILDGQPRSPNPSQPDPQVQRPSQTTTPERS